LKSQTVIVFFKSPEIGKVKTRLANEIGEVQACDVYKKLFSITHNVCKQWIERQAGRKLVFYGTGDRSMWNQMNVDNAKCQMGYDLGLRMENAIREELRVADNVCIIGTDLPEISVELLENAFERLEHKNTVLGPAKDGGFYLFGTSHMPINAFVDLSWSCANTLEVTERRLQGFGCDISKLQTLRDIDTKEDLDLFKKIIL
jgi:uncharacterized protein